MFILSKSLTSVLLGSSELALLLFGALLIAGLVGEYFADHKKKEYPRLKKRKHLFEVLVIVGVAGELIADGGIFAFSSHLQTIANAEKVRLEVISGGRIDAPVKQTGLPLKPTKMPRNSMNAPLLQKEKQSKQG